MNILYQVIEGRTHFGMARDAKMSLALNEPEKVALHLNSNHTSNRHHKRTLSIEIVFKTTNKKS